MILALPLSVLIGLVLGLLGGGGSILTLPILVYALDVPVKEAIATSLLVVGVTSAVAALAHARAGRVRWRVASIFGSAGMVGAFAGGRLASFIPATALLLGFAALMIAAAIAMLRPRRARPAMPAERALARVLVDGLLVGAVTGMVGAGGGFLITPALVLLGGLPMEIAVGTSLVIIAMQSFAGVAGHLGHVSIDLHHAALVSAAAVGGSLIGSRLAGRIAPSALRRGFAWLVVVMALFIIGRQLLPEMARDAPAPPTSGEKLPTG